MNENKWNGFPFIFKQTNQENYERNLRKTEELVKWDIDVYFIFIQIQLMIFMITIPITS